MSMATKSSRFVGFLPVRKPKNVCSNKLLRCMRDDFRASLGLVAENWRKSIAEIGYSRELEFFADGLLTFMIGPAVIYRRNFVFAEYRYRFTMQFGVEREFCSIDGNLISEQDTSHINREFIEQSLKSFIGTNVQARMTSYEVSQPRALLSPSQSIIHSIDHPPRERSPELLNQKYPRCPGSKEAQCYSIKLLDCDRWFATVELSCQGAFSVRRFAADFSDFIKTKLCLIELERLQEGPMCLDDLRVLESYDTQYELYMRRAAQLKYEYIRYLEQFDHHFVKE